MPFPLAHPAAVLPLRRACPRILDFPALLIGAVVPDAGYLLPGSNPGLLSHRISGIVLFSLPVGWVGYWIFRRGSQIMSKAARKGLRALPEEEGQRAARKGLRALPEEVGRISLSLMIGASTHVLWDSITHQDGWCVERFPVLRTCVGGWELFDILWYASTIGGAISLALACPLGGGTSGAGPGAGQGMGTRIGRTEPGYARVIWATLIVLALSIAHRVFASWPADIAIALFSALFVVFLIFRVGLAVPG
jgi:hypothetical protein